MKQLAIGLSLCLCCTVLADKPQLRAIPGQRIVPQSFAPVMVVNGKLVQTGDWIPYVDGTRGGDQGGISSASCQTVGYAACGANGLVFDMFEPDVAGGFPSDGAGSTGPITDCGLGGSRWFFGTGYLNPYLTNDMTVCEGAAGGTATAVDLGWYWGDGVLRNMMIAVLTGETFDDTCTAAVTAGAGWVINFGQSAGGGGFYFYSNVDFCGAATWQLPADGIGGYQIWFGSSAAGVFTLDGTAGTQEMLWGTDSERPGDQGPIEWDDDNPTSATWTAPTECYDYTFFLCPDPLGAMIAFRVDSASCLPCDTNCDGTINQFDIQSFITDLQNGGAGGCSPCAADTNSDGTVNQFDIQNFISCLGG